MLELLDEAAAPPFAPAAFPEAPPVAGVIVFLRPPLGGGPFGGPPGLPPVGGGPRGGPPTLTVFCLLINSWFLQSVLPASSYSITLVARTVPSAIAGDLFFLVS